MRSDSRPQSGAKTNCISENDENNRPIVRPMTSFDLPCQVGFGDSRQQRQYNGEAEQVDDDDQKDGQQARTAGRSVLGGVGRSVGFCRLMGCFRRPGDSERIPTPPMPGQPAQSA